MPSEKRVIVAEKINVEKNRTRYQPPQTGGAARNRQQYRQCAGENIGAAGGAVKEVVSTKASGVGTLIGGAAKAIGGMISMFASLFGW